MMAIQETDDVRIAVRLPRWLHEDLEECAKRSSWDLSKQIRFELASIRGKAPTPCLPTGEAPELSFHGPSHKAPERRRRRSA